MSTKRLFFCNLCRDEVGDGIDGSPRRLCRGFKFGSGRLDWDTMRNCENHLCDNCVEMLMASFKQAPPIVPVSSPSGCDK